MDDPISKIFVQWSVDESLAFLPVSGTVQDWEAFYGSLPDGSRDSDNAICFYDRPGLTQGRILATGETIERPALQVRVRATDYLTGYTKMRAIVEAIDAIARASVTVGGNNYIITSASRNMPIPLGPEGENRRRQAFVCNLLVKVKQL